MTNREWMETLDDRQLAYFLIDGVNGIKDCQKNCASFSCVDCIVDWLRTEDTPKKGDVRKVKGGSYPDGYYMIVKVQEKETKVMNPDGTFGWVSNSIFVTDEPTDVTAEDFLQAVVQNM